MSINPTSAPEPAVRETDSGSNQRNWSLLQGSRTGSKEGQFNSFWDNAVRGAQKLFGLEKTEQENEPKEDDRSDKETRDPANVGNGLNTVSGFSGSRFGLSLSMGRESMGLLPRFGRIDQAKIGSKDSSEPVALSFDESKENGVSRVGARERDRSQKQVSEQRVSNDEPKVSKTPEEVGESEEDKEAKTSPRSKTATDAPIISRASKFLNVNEQQVKVGATGLGAENAKLLPNMRSASPNQEKVHSPESVRSAVNSGLGQAAKPVVVATENAVQAPTVSSAKAISKPEAVESGPTALSQSSQRIVAQSENVQVETPRQGGVPAASTKESSLAKPVESKPVVNLSSPLEAKPAPDSEKIEVASKAKEPGESELKFDAGKAKTEVSVALQRQARVVRSAPATTQTISPTSEGPSEAPVKPLESGRSEVSENANAATETKGSGSELSSRMTTVARHRRSDVPVNTDQSRSQAAPNANQNATEHANANSRVVNPEKNEAVAGAGREVARVDLANRSHRSRFSNTNSSSNPLGAANSVSGAASATGLSQSGGSQSNAQQQGFEQGPKSDLMAAAKSTAAVARSDKGSDSGQSFDIQSANTSQSRRSQAALKSQPTSYANKTVQEVKEVVAMLTKSIDRLSATRQDTISVRVNFEHGGSLALKVSMDSGQVNTSFQTDVPGLEGALKSAWNDLVGEVAQKGIKLSQPQFGSSDGENRSENFASNDQREGRSQSAETNSGREKSRNGSNASGRGGDSSNAANSGESSEDSAEVDSTTSENELKTYA